ncbi:MAG: DUF4440 domain-containing protein [Ferruginibacter sp.]
MRKLYLLLTFCILSAPLFSQTGRLPCSRPLYRQFDFWIGEWEAFGLNGKKAGDSKISLQLDSCTILEEWTAAGLQRGLRYAGKSYNMYNAASKKWQQYWVDNTGNITQYFDGHFEDGKMILQTANEKLNDTSWQIQKMTFYNLSPDKVRQHGETSNDGGKTWTTGFDLEYRRKKDLANIIVDSMLRKMEADYHAGNFEKIAGYYSANGKIINKKIEAGGREELVKYWKGFERMGGTWKLTNEKSEKQGNLIWQKGVSVITDKQLKSYRVDFTLLWVEENGEWKILQDAYW